MIAIGIDPGLSGAIAAVCSQRGLLECADLPVCPNGIATGSMRNWLDAPALDELLADWSRRHDFAREDVAGFIERPIPMPTLPAQTIASQFDTFGAIRALLQARMRGRRPVAMVEPRAWKAIYGLKGEKDPARACCLRLYPKAPVTRVKDHNRAEAILIAHYGRRKVMDGDARLQRVTELSETF